VSTLGVSHQQKKYTDLLPAYEGVEYIDEGPATLINGGVSVGGRDISVPRTLIATGRPTLVPAIRGIEDIDFLDSSSLFELETLPASLIFVGTGYIGAELAQMMARMGVTRSRSPNCLLTKCRGRRLRATHAGLSSLSLTGKRTCCFGVRSLLQKVPTVSRRW